MTQVQRGKLIGVGALLLAAIIWGTSYVAQVSGMNELSPLGFNSLRLSLGALSLLPMLFMPSARHIRRSDWKATIFYSVFGGVILALALGLAQYGIYFSRSAGRAGFISSLYIVIVPLLGIFLGEHPGKRVFLSVALSLVGLYLLAFTGKNGGFNIGDALLLASAFASAIHLLIVQKSVPMVNPLHLSFGQVFVAATSSWVGALATATPPTIHAISIAWWTILYAGFLSTGVAYTLQIIGQNHIPPTPAALLMSLESFFSVVGGVLFLHESMSAQSYAGCLLMLLGTFASQIPMPHMHKKDRIKKVPSEAKLLGVTADLPEEDYDLYDADGDEYGKVEHIDDSQIIPRIDAPLAQDSPLAKGPTAADSLILAEAHLGPAAEEADSEQPDSKE